MLPLNSDRAESTATAGLGAHSRACAALTNARSPDQDRKAITRLCNTCLEGGVFRILGPSVVTSRL